MIFLQLAYEFFKTGLFAVGGGMATIPFLMDMTTRHDWFTIEELTNMIAISESTPGPIGVNMATYAGFQTAGLAGAAVATFSLVLPSFLIILIVSTILEKFRSNRYVDAAFSGIRPAVTGLLVYVCYTLLRLVILPEHEFAYIPLVIIVIAFILMQLNPFKKFHPVIWIALGAVLGIVLKL